MKRSVHLRSLQGLFVLVGLLTLVLAMPTAAAPALTDRSISDAIDDKLAADFLVPGNRVDVITTGGVVTLNGIVGNLQAKERAARVAERIRGVRAVVNLITVRPYVTRTADEIRNDIREALRLNPATEIFDVGIDVGNDGIVDLSGTVQSWAEKTLVQKVAKSVAGVTGIEDALTVDYASSRSDREIKREVEERLRWNALVDDGLIEVDVENGDVRLSGIVGSVAERREARLSAWITGVGRVDVGDLQVDRWARDEDLRNPANIELSDAAVAKAVMRAMRYDPRVDDTQIDVDVEDGATVLRGTAASLQAKRAAAQDARNTVGVVAVDDRIKVRPGALASDETIAADVRRALALDSIVERRDITVSVLDGIVTLVGVVDNYLEKAHADSVAASVKGVEFVRNFLTVVDERRFYTYNPYDDPWAPESFDWYDEVPRRTARSDVDIRAEVLSQLWWSPFVDSEEVNVEVDEGVVTLTGTVDSPAERNAARDNAFEAGAIWVVNYLKIDQS